MHDARRTHVCPSGQERPRWTLPLQKDVEKKRSTCLRVSNTAPPALPHTQTHTSSALWSPPWLANLWPVSRQPSLYSHRFPPNNFMNRRQQQRRENKEEKDGKWRRRGVKMEESKMKCCCVEQWRPQMMDKIQDKNRWSLYQNNKVPFWSENKLLKD